MGSGREGGGTRVVSGRGGGGGRERVGLVVGGMEGGGLGLHVLWGVGWLMSWHSCAGYGHAGDGRVEHEGVEDDYSGAGGD